MELSQKALEKIDTGIIISELVRTTGRSYPTIKRWITHNDPQLTRRDCLKVIMKESGLTEEELFEPETVVQP